ncbi:hypothetical protein CLAFUW4_01961 [Fulvia fulva]|uniref:RING-type domain-containing protein n=1 Tax=Passalora fulva TaxID=5499 RepID=A0A9Q8L5T8_PASFU|nr:uncharacterized protein CLAFUR5_01955 [Fulvia fulva]KAK4635217.1 hypothetical protein CLAFUR4_01956 [Fulvia fulva]KAK4638686.1 hypothetical protein CLAFUR0_01958 [Fulvia fulva]UJO11274.1 hypothetical protein CLAFUR5_01955 [Fulvia fulva]WPV08535.1 hypothetical protein CLAFUW4_01961 [Fulvia fulva]WPV24858.1 hypothetical protein CLAFUW7_01960 [Fulvia fulva]
MDVRDATIKDHYDDRDSSDLAVNSEYVASPGPDGIVIRKISASHEDKYTVRYQSRSQRCLALAFSPLRLNLLAAANGPQVLIFDVEKRRARNVLKGNGRVVTHIAWAHDDPRALATGSADGAICIWSLRTSSTPLYQLRGINSPCYAIAFKSDDWRYLAASHDGSVSTWNVARNRPIAVSRRRSLKPKVFRWTQTNRGTILNISPEGTVELLKVPNPLEAPGLTRLASIHEDLDNDDTPWYHSDNASLSLLVTFEVGYRIRQASAFGRHGIVVLPFQSTTLFFYAYPMDHGELMELWRLHADILIDSFATISRNNAANVLVSYATSAQSYTVPVQVLDGMGWEAERKALQQTVIRDSGSKPSGVAKGMMRAEPSRRVKIISSRSPLLSPTPEAVIKSPVKQKRKAQKKLPRVEESGSETPISRAMTSSLELPNESNADGDENDSPMPFLSPSIPARKVSPGSMLAPLDESLYLPPPRASFDSISTMATNDNDSDSDDETFAADMQGSSSYLPGGVNVPLPRSCGAAFNANGQLLTFFPTRYEDQIELQPQQNEVTRSAGRGTRTTQLFPSFGNLASSSPSRDSVLDSDNESNAEKTEPTVPQFAIKPSSFDSRPSWKLKTSPIKATSATFFNGGTVNVSVHNVEELTPTRKLLAAKYRMLQDDTEDLGKVCRENASSAEDEDLPATADLWRLLALLPESTAADGYQPQRSNDMSVVSTGYAGLETSMNNSLAQPLAGLPSGSTNLTFPYHPLDKAWAFERIFAQAEALASVQLLACMSAILKQASQRHLQSPKLPQQPPTTQSVVKAKRSPTREVASIDSTRYPPGIPILQASSVRSGHSTNSPRKRHGSQNSSRNASQPGTPYIDSSNSTPPLTLPSLPRQNSKLTVSGSVSPEHHRSSFSIAAKNYAASIAEKLSSYGSSPPTKRLGTSPGNELSTSLPDRSTGSWSKTVSFASNLDAGKTDRRSLSLAQQDDNYDSDRTVDDSLPHTPKQSGISVVFKTKNDMFFGEELLPAPEPLLTEQLAIKGHSWRQSYAEQLRSWDMVLEATELENVGAFDDRPAEVAGPISDAFVIPMATTGRLAVECSICFCLIQAAEQMCPSCLHVTHPACLEDVVSSIEAGDFTCPTGCGCHCATVDISNLQFTNLENGTEEHGNRFGTRKNPSLTDPLRLRQFDYGNG